MTLAIEKITVPLFESPDGTVRVTGTRVLLDMVIHSFNAGASAEEIVESFPSLKLPDVYAVISFYLQHRLDFDAYLARRQAEADDLRRKIEASQESNASLKSRLLARKQQRENIGQ